METLGHWTQRSVADFVYSISSNFVAQLEVKMEEEQISKSELANRLQRTSGRVSQVFNDPGNLSLKTIVEYARSLGMKVGIVAYDDNDPANKKGPINPEVFVNCWKKAAMPTDLFEVQQSSSRPVVHAQSNFLHGFQHVLTLNSVSTGGNVLGLITATKVHSSPTINVNVNELAGFSRTVQNTPVRLAEAS